MTMKVTLPPPPVDYSVNNSACKTENQKRTVLNNAEQVSYNTSEETIDPDSFEAWLKDEDKVSTDGCDDGKISVKEALTSFGKGLAGIVKTAINHPVKTALGVAAGVGLTVATGGAALPVMVAAGAVIGGGSIAYGGYKAITAESDGEAKQAFETMGNGTFALATSALSAKQALNSAANAGVKSAEGLASSNPIKNVINCFKTTPESVSVSAANIKGNVLTAATGTVHANSNALRKDSVKYMSKANEAEAYRFNPNGTDEEILANNPGVFKGEDGKFYVNNKWDSAHPFEIDTTKEQMIMMYDGMDDMAVCAGDIFEGSYVDTAAFKASGALEYQSPSAQNYGEVISVTKQAPGSCVQAPVGTKVQTLEGVTTVGEGQVIAVDHAGNPYVTPASNIIKRNTPLEGYESAFEALK